MTYDQLVDKRGELMELLGNSNDPSARQAIALKRVGVLIEFDELGAEVLDQGYGRNLVIDNEFTYIVATGKWRTNAVDKWYSSRGPEYFYKKVKQGEYV
jgi:hypothetical protein